MFGHTTFSFSRWGAGIAIALFVLPLGITLVPTHTHATASGSAVIVTSDLTRDPREGIAGTIGLDTVAWMLAKTIINDIVMEVKTLVEQGFFGDLMFLVDPQAFIAKLSRDVTNNLIGEIAGLDTYEPLKRGMMKLLSVTYTPYAIRAQSTIEDVLVEPEAFFDDFSQGGWTGFLSTLEPQNNPYGQYYMAMEENRRRVEEKKNEIYRELNEGGGVLSLPGNCIESVGIDTNGDGSIDASDGCINWERVNPGQFVAAEMSNALGSRVDSLENADDIGEILTATLQELVAGIINNGFDAARSSIRSGVRDTLTGGGSSSYGFYGSGSYAPEPDQNLIKAIEEDLALVHSTNDFLANVIDAREAVREAIITIDATLSDQDDYEDALLGYPGLLSVNELSGLRGEAITIQDETTLILTQADSTGSLEVYISELESLLAQAEVARESVDKINAWEAYNNFKQRNAAMTRMFGTSIALEQSPAHTAMIARAHEIYDIVAINYNSFLSLSSNE